MNLLKVLRQPYPIAESGGNEWLIGAFVGGFLLLFQPFGLDDWQTTDKALKILGFGVITTGVMLAFQELAKAIPSFFAEKYWTVGREMIRVLLLQLLIALANRLYLSWLLGWDLRGGWLTALAMTFLVGIFPTVGGILANYIYQLRRYQQRASLLITPHSAPSTRVGTAPITGLQPDQKADQPVVDELITLVADNEKDRLTIRPADLLAIESSDNYCTVFYLAKGVITRELMRSSLTRLGGQFAHPDLVRCHRSYLVNLALVERVTGNAQGYKLHLAGSSLLVPVARKYNETLVARLRRPDPSTYLARPDHDPFLGH